ncbi:Phosphoglycerate mutase-like protein AT74H [Diplonema papillatum]|nr:Phosphoglycerate mutase-like protein AT74H [Diplonema papillatum]|eukprot:gene6110-9382_t
MILLLAGFLSGIGAAAVAGLCFKDAIVTAIDRELLRRKIAAMPTRIILVRHGESEANVNPRVWEEKPDNTIELTERGCEQSQEVGRRLRELIKHEKVAAVVSPFWRTFMTMRNILKELPPAQVMEVRIEPRVREQEFGNVQCSQAMARFKKLQITVGRFWYRFPEGESGADVYARVASCLGSLKSINRRPRERVDNILVVTHGLTMRLLVAAEMAWSPDTFHTVYNPSNCEMWVLKKTASGQYELSTEGSMPRSDRRVHVHYKDGRVEECLVRNYLDLPQPRTAYPEVVLERLGIPREEVEKIDWWCGAYKRLD